MGHKLVLLINPPNSSTVVAGQSLRVGNPSEHSDWSNYPATGILVLASVLKAVPNIEPVYIDGVVFPFAEILDFITVHKDQIVIIGMSMLTDTYEAGLKILEHARCVNPKITHIVGNDHFTALPELCLRNRRGLIDFGFVGNEVIHGMQGLIGNIVNGRSYPLSDLPGLIFQRSGHIVSIPQKAEPIFTNIDYHLLDEVFPHSAYYDRVFRNTLSPRLESWFGCSVNRGIAVEIARGCIKFRNNDACSFCSIQYGGLWKNSVPSAKAAWDVIQHAYQAGYDYFYLTADELALTFPQLLLDMREDMPPWILRLPENKRPILTGYARTDGVMVEKNAQLLFDLGFRVIMVGVDAGPTISLQAVNKQFKGSNTAIRIEHLYEANKRAFVQAKKVGLKLRIGFVVGHIGMTRELLQENVRYFCDLVSDNPEAICTADIEILSPEPGSKEYQYLLSPSLALRKAHELGLEIADATIREHIAAQWQIQDILSREKLVSDYVTAFMPDLSIDDLIEARWQMRDFCHKRGVLIGGG